MSKVTAIFQTFRPPFLLLTPICIFLGASLAHYHGAAIDVGTVLLIFIGALSAHISVNTLNEYHDFNSGLDLATTKTPFSGGSGSLPQNPELAAIIKKIGIITLLITVVIGCYFIFKYTTTILPFGLLGVIIIVTYTKWLNKIPLLCLISPGLGFSTLMMVGTYLILAGSTNEKVWLVSLIPFLQINNLLLLNQYPDIAADKDNGRRTFPIAYGINASNWNFALCGILAFLSIVWLVSAKILPNSCLWVLLLTPLLAFSLRGIITFRENIGQHHKYLAANVATSLLTPLFIAICLSVSHVS